MKKCILLLLILTIPLYLVSQGTRTIKLPEPQVTKGKPLMQALKERKSTREYSVKDIPLQEISNLLWAANGINRKETGLHTAPTASNRQELEVFLSDKSGLYRYDAKEHSLVTIHNRDIRAETGTQDYVAAAPVNLIIVADFNKMGTNRQANIETANIDAGFICQNIYLYCASENLATVVRGSFMREQLAKEMGLGSNYYIVITQTVGYPR